MRLVLVRHGETEWNREGRIQGHSDGRLNQRGLRQAEALASALRPFLEGLRQHGPVALYASPVARARQTAKAIGDACGLAVVPLDALAEVNAGELDGLKAAEMRERYPEFMERWRRSPSTAVMPGGESLAQLQERVWDAVQGLLQRHAGETVVAVSHNFAIQSLLCRALDVSLDHFGRFRIDLGAFSVLDLGQRHAVLLRHNDRCHLEDLDLPPRE